MACSCLDDFDVKLAGRNTRLVRTFVLRPHQCEFPKIAVEKIDPRHREVVIAVPTYCPFCGVAYSANASQVQDLEAQRS